MVSRVAELEAALAREMRVSKALREVGLALGTTLARIALGTAAFTRAALATTGLGPITFWATTFRPAAFARRTKLRTSALGTATVGSTHLARAAFRSALRTIALAGSLVTISR